MTGRESAEFWRKVSLVFLLALLKLRNQRLLYFQSQLFFTKPARSGFDVLQNLEVVRIFLNGETLEPALVHVADACCSMCCMPALCVGHCDPLHERRGITIATRPKQQMPMIQ